MCQSSAAENTLPRLEAIAVSHVLYDRVAVPGMFTRTSRSAWNIHANGSRYLKYSRDRVVARILAKIRNATSGTARSRATILDPPRSYARWGRSVLRTADAAAHRNRETVKAFQHGRPGESDHGPAARLMYFLRGTVEIPEKRKEIEKEKEEKREGQAGE